MSLLRLKLNRASTTTLEFHKLDRAGRLLLNLLQYSLEKQFIKSKFYSVISLFKPNLNIVILFNL